MAEFRDLLEQLGYHDVASYLQSGQAVLTALGEDEESVAARISDALEDRFGVAIDVIVRGHEYLSRVVEDCPFPTAGIEGKQLHAAFFAAAPDPEPFEQLDREAFLPEQFHLGDRVLYLSLPGGIGRSRLATQILRPRVIGRGAVVTVRNWNTVAKLVELTG
jgi:uncharacterized protein (DUF1697 family)